MYTGITKGASNNSEMRTLRKLVRRSNAAGASGQGGHWGVGAGGGTVGGGVAGAGGAVGAVCVSGGASACVCGASSCTVCSRKKEGRGGTCE